MFLEDDRGESLGSTFCPPKHGRGLANRSNGLVAKRLRTMPCDCTEADLWNTGQTEDRIVVGLRRASGSGLTCLRVEVRDGRGYCAALNDMDRSASQQPLLQGPQAFIDRRRP